MRGWVRKTFKLLRSVKTSGNSGRPLKPKFTKNKISRRETAWTKDFLHADLTTADQFIIQFCRETMNICRTSIIKCRPND